MKLGGKWLLIVLVALAAALSGINFGRRSSVPEQRQPGPESEAAVAQLMTLTFLTPEGQTRKLADWQGKVLVINFWATWCPPCREEMPELSRVQDQYGPAGIQLLGVAIDETANVVEFSKKTPVTYPLLIAPAELPGLFAKLGNQQQGLPFTIIVGRDGKLRSSHLGRLSEEYLGKLL